MSHSSVTFRGALIVSGLAVAILSWANAAPLAGFPDFGVISTAQAQGAQRDCILDNCADRNDSNGRGNYRARDRFRDDDRRGGRGNYGSAPGRFDFYVLSLSWSPSFCNSEAGRRSRFQCRIGARNAFVVHGLWPQYNRGSPSYCSQENPPRNVVEGEGRVFPEFGLARYQWRKHGSCSGLSPSAYFKTVQQARDKIVIPPALQSLSNGSQANPDAIEKAFLVANKGLRPDNVAVTCKDGNLEEVRVCMSKDLRSYVSCPEVDRRACRASSVSIPPPR